MTVSRLLIFVGGVIAGAALAAFVGFSNGMNLQGNIDTVLDFSRDLVPVRGNTPIHLSESTAISVKDQQAGMSVFVDAVTVPPPGVWVAVQETDTTGQLGNVLGAGRTHGPVSDFSIPLLRTTEAGREYAIVLYRDDGDSSFDSVNDSVYVDFDSGDRVVALWKTLP